MDFLIAILYYLYENNMKTSKDPRHLQRIEIMQQLFAWDFHRQELPQNPLANDIINNLEIINQHIVKAAPNWPLEKINKIDLAILRLATFELLIKPETPEKVIIDEAVELAKEYGSESSPAFINGALGTLVHELPHRE